MPVKFVCDECRRMLSISRKKIGKEIDCPCCGHELHVPTEAAAQERIAELEERRELRRLKRQLKFPDLAVYDEQPGASAANASSLSDPRLHRQSRKTRAAQKAAATANSADDGSSTALAPDVDEIEEDWTAEPDLDSRVVIDDSNEGEELHLPPVSSPRRRSVTSPPEEEAEAAEEEVVRAEPALHTAHVRNERLEGYRRARERRNHLLKAAGVMALGAALFMAGWFAGNSSSGTASWLDSEITVSGGVMFTRATGDTAPDHGALVFFLPVDQYPPRRVDVAGLIASKEELSPHHAGVLAIEEFGGAFAQADATGEFRTKLPAEGSYLVLIVSANTTQSDSERISVDDDAQLSKYFSSGSGLVGEQRYRLMSQDLSDNGQRVSHLFQVGG